MKTNYKKIDIYLKSLNGFWKYECSTTWAKSCKYAKERFLIRYGLDNSQVKAVYSK